MLRKIRTSLLCLTLGTTLIGCASSGTTPVYVLNGDEIIMVSKGQVITAPYDGTFYSARAEKRVMNAKKVAVDLK